MQKIAVWNTAFLGDAVLTLPLIQSLHACYPEASIDFYVRQGLAPLFTEHPALREVISYDKRGGQKGVLSGLALIRETAAKKYDLWIGAHTSLRSSLIAKAAGAPVRIGYSESSLAKICYTHRVSRKFDALEEIERLLALLAPLRSFGCAQDPEDWPEIYLPQAAQERAAELFRNITGPVLGMHPGSVWPTKRWPAAYFAAIGKRALAMGAHVALFAGSGEETIAGEVLDSLRCGTILDDGHIHDFSGRLSLPELAACLPFLSCYLTNDSGPMHLAWAQKVPVTAIFGPTVKALGFFPRGENASVYEADLSCRPCGLHGSLHCPLGHHECMKKVTPDVVWPDVRRKLCAV